MTASIEVACATEGARYLGHAAAMLHSLLTHHPGEVRIHYMHGEDMKPRHRRRMAEMVGRMNGEIEFIDIPDKRLEGLPMKGFTRKATWYRIFLPELLGQADRVLYLDADLVVVDDLRPLWETDLGSHYLAAAHNVLEPMYLDRPSELGLPPDQLYFNAGVLLMNLAEMRRNRCSDALLEFGVREAPQLLWRDQDALNVVLGGRRLVLHPRWNCMNSVMFLPWGKDFFGEEAVAEARRSPAIRHFEGPDHNKPWHLLCERELREVYVSHRRETPWPRIRKEGVTPLNLARLLRRRLRRFVRALRT